MKLTDKRRQEIVEETQRTGKMNLFPNELEEMMKEFPLYSRDGKREKAKVLVKFFNASGSGTWIALEGDKEGEDIEFFGYCCITDWEYGYFTLKELQGLQDKGFMIEIDLYSTGETLEDFLKQEGQWEEYKATFLKDDEEEEEEWFTTERKLKFTKIFLYCKN